MRRNLEVSVRDLNTMRMTCGPCGTTVEFLTSDFAKQFPEGKCLRCGQELFDAKKGNPFSGFVESIRRLQEPGWLANVSFSIPVEEEISD